MRLSGNGLEYSGHVREIRVSEGSYGIESHVGKTENQECKFMVGRHAPSNSLQAGAEISACVGAGDA